MIYSLLQTVSAAIFGLVTTIWLIEDTLINLMMRFFLLMLRFACHPIMIMPTLIGVYYLVRKLWLRRRPTSPQLDRELLTHRPVNLSARVGSHRIQGTMSARSIDSCEGEEEEMIGSRSNRV